MLVHMCTMQGMNVRVFLFKISKIKKRKNYKCEFFPSYSIARYYLLLSIHDSLLNSSWGIICSISINLDSNIFLFFFLEYIITYGGGV